MTRLRLTLTAAVIALATATNAQAVLLSDLFNGDSIQAGDKIFSNWNLNFQDYSDAGLTVDPANVEVTALNDGGNDPGPGLRFDMLSDVFSVTGDGIFAYIDYRLEFTVTSLEGPIKDASMDLTGVQLLFPTEDLGVSIGEYVDAAVNNVENSYSGVAGTISNPTASADFAPQNPLQVETDLFVWAVDSGETAKLLSFEQRFSQVALPSPGTLALFGLGLTGLFFRRRG